MNKFYVIIYHPSRFAPLTPINMLIYRYLNSVIDTSKTEKSITLSITIWGYPSRFSHHTLSDTAYFCWNTLTMDGTRKWHGFMEWNILFHTMKLFVSSGETLRFILWNEQTRLKAFALSESSGVCFTRKWKSSGFCFTRKRIRLLLHND